MWSLEFRRPSKRFYISQSHDIEEIFFYFLSFSVHFPSLSLIFISSILFFTGFSLLDFRMIFSSQFGCFHLTRVYFERVIPPRPRPLTIPPPNFLAGDDFEKFPPRPPPPRLFPLKFDVLLVLMMSSKLISILSSILISFCSF